MVLKNNLETLARMSLDIQMRGLSGNTLKCYLRYAGKFLEHCGKNADELDETDARDFLVHLMREGRLENSSINQYNAAIRFLFAVTLNRTINYLQLPRFKKCRTFPEILTREETQRLIAGCANVKHKSFFLLAYGGGLRINEIATSRVQDIDSKSMRVFVKDGKGKKDRYTILSNECLCTLREYWSVYRPKNPDGWLFPGIGKHKHISTQAIADAFNNWAARAGITKDVSTHTLRHCFASHLLEDGVDIFQIKEMLGHACLSSTAVYLHLANTTAGIVSPADRYVHYD